MNANQATNQDSTFSIFIHSLGVDGVNKNGI